MTLGIYPPPGVGGGGVTAVLTTKGDVWGYSNGNARIPVGSNGQVLTADSTQTLGVKWASPTVYATSPLTTKGDVWVFGSADARLPVGTNGDVLTADSTQTLGVKWAAAAAGSGTDDFHRSPRTAPTVASFTSVGTFATLADRVSRLAVEVSSIASGAAGALRILTRSIPSTPYTIDVCAAIVGNAGGTNEVMCGPMLYDGTKVMAFYNGAFNASGTSFRVASWTNTTSASAAVFNSIAYLGGPAYWARITDNGTTRSYYGSDNGKEWFLVGSQASGTFLTPTHYGLCFYNNGGGINAKATIYHLSVTASIVGDES